MTERRKWKVEEKLANIKEINEKGKVVGTCRKYSIDLGMEPTNNLAEQAIREHVVIRKIISTFMTESR